MKKILYIAIPLIILVILSLFLISQRKKVTDQPNSEADVSDPAALPESTPGNQPQSIDPVTSLEKTSNDQLLQDTPSGQVKINNFAKMAEQADNGIIYLIDKNNYNIGYNPTSQEYIVTLLVTKNIEEIRQNAENDLLNSLGISRIDACKLNVYLYVSAALTKDDKMSQNHGLSFCPGNQLF